MCLLKCVKSYSIDWSQKKLGNYTNRPDIFHFECSRDSSSGSITLQKGEDMIALLIKMILPLLLSLNIAAEIPLLRNSDNLSRMDYERSQQILQNADNLNNPLTFAEQEYEAAIDPEKYRNKSDVSNYLSVLLGQKNTKRALRQHIQEWPLRRTEIKSTEEHRSLEEKRNDLFMPGSFRGRRSAESRR